MTEREFSIRIVRRLRDAGHQALWAGGCVRDELLGREPADYDVATDARPEQVQALFPHSLAIGAAFGVIEVVGPRRPDGVHPSVEVATFRADGEYSDGRRPDSVAYCGAEEDARRRDFTINGMFFDPLERQLHDYVGGRADLDAKILRAIGDPRERFREDKLRLLRGVRMAARFGLDMDPDTAAAIRDMAGQVTVVSPERVAEELRKTLAHPSRATGVRLMRALGLCAPVLPEAAPTPEADATLAALPAESSFESALAALLFPANPKVAAKLAARLKLANAERDRAAWLLEHLPRAPGYRALRLAERKRLLAHPGSGEWRALARAAGEARGWDAADIDAADADAASIPPEVLDPPPLVTGADLIARGLTPGPEFKRILDAVRDAQLDERIATREEALGMVP